MSMWILLAVQVLSVVVLFLMIRGLRRRLNELSFRVWKEADRVNTIGMAIGRALELMKKYDQVIWEQTQRRQTQYDNRKGSPGSGKSSR